MRKEISVSDTKTEYYCDVCGEEVKGYTSYGSPTYPDQIIKVCAICKRDICPKCYSNIYHWHICKDCQEAHKDLIDLIVHNEAKYRAKCQELNQRLKAVIDA